MLSSLENAMSDRSAALVRHLPVGSWRLHPGHAMRLQPQRPAVLRVDCGRVWVTLGQGPATGALFEMPNKERRIKKHIEVARPNFKTRVQQIAFLQFM